MPAQVQPVIWRAQAGGQEDLLSCPVDEAFLEGNRGGGKTEALLMDFAQHVGQGFGEHWRGILFRRTYKELEDAASKIQQLWPQVWPGTRLNLGNYSYEWPTGEKFLLRYFNKPTDYWGYHGHGYPWIGWEELTTWASPAGYFSMFACNRSSRPGMPRKVRATGNPYGVGHNWVKSRFIDPGHPGTIVTEDVEDILGNKYTLRRVRIRSMLSENKKLVEADPQYIARLVVQANGDPIKLKAWLEGDWDIIAGGMFDDVWDARTHFIPRFPIPESWYVDRSFDWGSSKPFSVGWWAESDGTKAPNGVTYPRGTLFRIHEWYGWNGRPNEGLKMLNVDIAKGIREREDTLIRERWVKSIRPGPADTQIFNVANGTSIAADMKKLGIVWQEADKSPGSRKNGAQLMRGRFQASKQEPREGPGLFVFEHCLHFKRTVPVLPRSEKDPDDVDSEAEDHVYDETRYRALHKRSETRIVKLLGV